MMDPSFAISDQQISSLKNRQDEKLFNFEQNWTWKGYDLR